MNPKKDKYDEEFLKAQKYMLDRVCQDVGESAKYYKKLCKSTTASTPLQRMYMNMFCNLSNSADAIYFLILSKKGREALIVAGHMIEGLALFLYAKRYRKALKYYDYMSIKCLQLHYMEEVIYGNVGPVQNEKCRDNDIEFIKKYGAKFLKSKTGIKISTIVSQLKNSEIAPEEKISILKKSFKHSWYSGSIESIIKERLKDGDLLHIYERYCHIKHHNDSNFIICCDTVQIKDGLWEMALAQGAVREILDRMIHIGQDVMPKARK